MLRLRSEAAKGIADLFFNLERDDSSYDSDQRGDSFKGKIDDFRRLGARIGKVHGGFADETDHKGRLKQN